jgi:hypothetical protein
MVATRSGKAPAPAKANRREVAKRGRADDATPPTTTTRTPKERELLRKVRRVADVLSERRRRARGAGAAGPAGAMTMSGGIARPFQQKKFERVGVPDGDRERAAGVPDEYRFEELIEQAKAAASQRARPVSPTSLNPSLYER